MLSKNQINEIKSACFDEVRELENLLSKLKAAKAAGEATSVTELLRQITFKKDKPKTTIKKNTNKSEISAIEQSA